MSSKTKVLVLDDDKTIHDLIKEMLKEEDCELNCVTNVDEGLNLLDSFQPDIAVVDYKLAASTSLRFVEVAKAIVL